MWCLHGGSHDGRHDDCSSSLDQCQGGGSGKCLRVFEIAFLRLRSSPSRTTSPPWTTRTARVVHRTRLGPPIVSSPALIRPPPADDESTALSLRTAIPVQSAAHAHFCLSLRAWCARISGTIACKDNPALLSQRASRRRPSRDRRGALAGRWCVRQAEVNARVTAALDERGMGSAALQPRRAARQLCLSERG